MPSGICTSFSETGYYISTTDRDVKMATEIANSLGASSNNVSLLSNCQKGLLKLSCDYYYPPCVPDTFEQEAICQSSCDSVSLILNECRNQVGNDTLLNDLAMLDCSNPNSYLVTNVSASQTQCIDLTAYGMFVR